MYFKETVEKIVNTREWFKAEMKKLGFTFPAVSYTHLVEDKYKDAIKEHSMDSFMKVDMEWAGKILFKNHNKFN